jgi:mannosyl-3-phosphoglycerate phosphatase
VTFPHLVIFSDLDDTLFAPHRLSIDQETRRRIGLIRRQQIPLVFASSRTRAEFEVFQHELGIAQPFICENNAAVCVPRKYFRFAVAHDRDVSGHEVIEFGKPYNDIVATLHHLSAQLDIDVLALSEMSVEELALECRVTMSQARLAKKREYSERFRILDDRRGSVLRLITALDLAGLVCTSRGRHHWIGVNRYDAAGTHLRGLFRRAFGEVVTVAFCDHATATPLLHQADIPLVVPSVSSDQTKLLLARAPMAHLCAADSIGAWAEVILQLAGVVAKNPSAGRSWQSLGPTWSGSSQ